MLPMGWHATIICKFKGCFSALSTQQGWGKNKLYFMEVLKKKFRQIPIRMRIELFFKTPSQALATIGMLVRAPVDISGFNLPNKVMNDCTLQTARAIKEAFPSSQSVNRSTTDLCVHYSLKNNPEKTIESAAGRLKNFLSDAQRAGASKVLLVSGGNGGGGKMRKKVNTVTCLQQLQHEGFKMPSGLELGVAFNPYYPTPEHAQEEFQRLQEKLDTRLVSHVWINAGSDVRALEAALVAFNDLRDNHLPYLKDVRLIGSLFIPSKDLLNKFRFRMWSGLFLSERYMESVEGAMEVTSAIQALYARFGVEPLVESAIRTERELAQLVQVASAAPCSPPESLSASLGQEKSLSGPGRYGCRASRPSPQLD